MAGRLDNWLVKDQPFVEDRNTDQMPLEDAFTRRSAMTFFAGGLAGAGGLAALLMTKRALFPPPSPDRDPGKLKEDARLKRVQELRDYPRTGRTALLGDSIFGLMDAPTFLGSDYANFGVNGAEAPELFDLAPTVNKSAQRVIILVGINSVRIPRPLPEIAAGILKLRSLITLPSMVIAPLPVVEGAFGIHNAWLVKLRDMLSSVSPPENTMCDASGGARPGYTSDGMHLSGLGFKGLAAEIRRREAAMSWL